MATQVIIPSLGETIEVGVIYEWKKKDGDEIKKGDVICEIEIEKAILEIEASEDGILLQRFYKEGDEVKAHTIIAVLGEMGEDVSSYAPLKDEPESSIPPLEEINATIHSRFLLKEERDLSEARAGTKKISPRAKKLAQKKGLDIFSIKGSGPAGRITEKDVEKALSQREPLSPAAVATLEAADKKAPYFGTGVGGRILTNDLEKSDSDLHPRIRRLDYPGPVREVPLKGIRKIISQRMFESLQTSAQLTLHTSADATRLLACKKKLQDQSKGKGFQEISINDMVLFCVSRTLIRHKSLNSHILENKILEFDHIHIGIAVDTPRGLMVPVIQNAQALSLKEISEEANRLISSCKKGNVGPEELTGGTFTVSNLGPLGIENFTPILKKPEVAILGICSIQTKPFMTDKDIKFVPSLGLSLTFDHRALDGAPAARFLRELADMIGRFDSVL
jgi:pyruvate dehydrogenase E2 component (dihydrolipoamide acetyltransferase)